MRIEAATQMESVLGAGGTPNCLVIDEIDGAPMVGLLGTLAGGQGVGSCGCSSLCSLHDPQAAVNILLSILDRKGPQEAEPGSLAVPTGVGRRRWAGGGLLMRPVVCICNDP